jgi:predicted dienelactone hydrolase
VDHWGNTYDNKIPVEFVKPWERPLDISLALTELRKHRRFKEAIDEKRIGALGFSYGGYTVLALAGAVVDYKILLRYFATEEGKRDLDAITEFPGLSELIGKPAFTAMTNNVPELKDTRIKAFFAISPGTASGFISKEQFNDIDAPVFIVGCEADSVTPVEKYAKHYHRLIDGSDYYEFSGHVGHYVMLSEVNEALQNESPIPFSDHPTVNRKKVHQKVAELAGNFFGESLKP